MNDNECEYREHLNVTIFEQKYKFQKNYGKTNFFYTS